jgi:hypothetical protein
MDFLLEIQDLLEPDLLGQVAAPDTQQREPPALHSWRLRGESGPQVGRHLGTQGDRLTMGAGDGNVLPAIGLDRGIERRVGKGQAHGTQQTRVDAHRGGKQGEEAASTHASHLILIAPEWNQALTTVEDVLQGGTETRLPQARQAVQQEPATDARDQPLQTRLLALLRLGELRAQAPKASSRPLGTSDSALSISSIKTTTPLAGSQPGISSGTGRLSSMARSRAWFQSKAHHRARGCR